MEDVHPESNSAECFSLTLDGNQTSAVLTNQRVDYTLRSPNLHVSLYDFAAEFYKDKRPTKGKLSENSFPFADKHPQSKTHMLMRHKNKYSFKVPVIVGAQFPSKDKNPERYYMLFLILFKSFFSVTDLKTHDTWELSFSHWWNDVLSDDDRHRLSKYERNISALSSGREQQKAEQEARAKLRAEQGLDENDPSASRFTSFDPYDEMFAPPASLDGLFTSAASASLSIPKPDPKTPTGLFAMNALLAMSRHGGLRSIVPMTTNVTDSGLDQQQTSTYIVSPADNNILSTKATSDRLKNSITKEKANAINRQIHEAAAAAPTETSSAPSSSSSSSSGAPDVCPSSALAPAGVISDDLLEDIITEFTLNTEQAIAFKLVGKALLLEITGSPTQVNPQVHSIFYAQP